MGAGAYNVQTCRGERSDQEERGSARWRCEGKCIGSARERGRGECQFGCPCGCSVGYQRHRSVLPEDCQTGIRGFVASEMCADSPRNVHTLNIGARSGMQRREGWLGLWSAKRKSKE